MGIVPRFSDADVKKVLNERLKRIDTVVINYLTLIGEQFVRDARENGDYNDITGNLRSSVGYIILKNGATIAENFQQSERGTDKTEGVSKAKVFIAEIASNFKTGYALIVVAGMEYAAAVESRGRDVLTASSIKAKNSLRKAIREIKKKI